MTIERTSLLSKIRQVIDNEILQYKHKLLDFGHEAKYCDVFEDDGCSAANSSEDLKFEIREIERFKNLFKRFLFPILDFLFKFLVRKNFLGFLFTYRNNFLIIFFP